MRALFSTLPVLATFVPFTVFAAGQLPDGTSSTTSPAPASPASSTASADSSEVDDSLWYLRFGAGFAIASGVKGGPAFGAGYRYNFSHYGIDASIFDWVLTQKDGSPDNPAGPFVKLALLSYSDPLAPDSLYGGVGIGWGVASATIDGTHFINNGFEVGLTAGYEMRRTSELRWFVQLDANLPTYVAHGDVPGYESLTYTLTRESRYIPSFALTLGVALGTPRKP